MPTTNGRNPEHIFAQIAEDCRTLLARHYQEFSIELKNAVLEIQEACKAKDYALATSLLSVKRYINSAPHGRFWEDNTETKGEFYSILDEASFNACMALNQIPHGTLVLTRGAAHENPGPTPGPESPTLTLLQIEEQELHSRTGNYAE